MAHFENCEEDYCKCEEMVIPTITGGVDESPSFIYYDPSETNSPQ